MDPSVDDFADLAAMLCVAWRGAFNCGVFSSSLNESIPRSFLLVTARWNVSPSSQIFNMRTLTSPIDSNHQKQNTKDPKMRPNSTPVVTMRQFPGKASFFLPLQVAFTQGTLNKCCGAIGWKKFTMHAEKMDVSKLTFVEKASKISTCPCKMINRLLKT